MPSFRTNVVTQKNVLCSSTTSLVVSWNPTGIDLNENPFTLDVPYKACTSYKRFTKRAKVSFYVRDLFFFCVFGTICTRLVNELHTHNLLTKII